MAETFCHLLTVSWEKLTEIRAFYDKSLPGPGSVTPVSSLEVEGESKPRVAWEKYDTIQHGSKSENPTKSVDFPMKHPTLTTPSSTLVSQESSSLKSVSDGSSRKTKSFEPEEVTMSPTKSKIKKKSRKRCPRPSFSSVLHDNHELRRITCKAISSATNSSDKVDMEADESKDEGKSKSSVDMRRSSTLCPLPVIFDHKDSDDDRTTSHRRISDGEVC